MLAVYHTTAVPPNDSRGGRLKFTGNYFIAEELVLSG